MDNTIGPTSEQQDTQHRRAGTSRDAPPFASASSGGWHGGRQEAQPAAKCLQPLNQKKGSGWHGAPHTPFRDHARLVGGCLPTWPIVALESRCRPPSTFPIRADSVPAPTSLAKNRCRKVRRSPCISRLAVDFPTICGPIRSFWPSFPFSFYLFLITAFLVLGQPSPHPKMSSSGSPRAGRRSSHAHLPYSPPSPHLISSTATIRAAWHRGLNGKSPTRHSDRMPPSKFLQLSHCLRAHHHYRPSWHPHLAFFSFRGTGQCPVPSS